MNVHVATSPNAQNIYSRLVKEEYIGFIIPRVFVERRPIPIHVDSTGPQFHEEPGCARASRTTIDPHEHGIGFGVVSALEEVEKHVMRSM